MGVTQWISERLDSSNLPDQFTRRISELQQQSNLSLRSNWQEIPILNNLRHVIQLTSFNNWARKIHDLSEVNTILAEAKQSATKDFEAQLDQFNNSISAAIRCAYIGVSNFVTIARRLSVLKHRFNRLPASDEPINCHQPIDISFDFLSALTDVRPEITALHLLRQCYAIYGQINVHDLRSDTDISAKMADWFSELHYRGAECVSAGLETQVKTLAEVSQQILLNLSESEIKQVLWE
ncbi:MAG: hypothetical protein Q9162_007854 [Coniocarpon cinnabarinum]